MAQIGGFIYTTAFMESVKAMAKSTNHRTARIPARAHLATTAAGLLTFLAACDIPQTITIADPVDIKTNEVLGIKLGLNFADYKKQHHKMVKDQCTEPDLDTEVMCNIFIDSTSISKPSLTLGGKDVYMYTLIFFDGGLIDIDYSLVGLDWEPLKQSLEAKFGQPMKLDKNRWRWYGKVSSLTLEENSTDFSAAKVELKLDGKITEWLDRSSKRKSKEAKGDL